jgi:hypothetical protein
MRILREYALPIVCISIIIVNLILMRHAYYVSLSPGAYIRTQTWLAPDETWKDGETVEDCRKWMWW